MDKFRSINFFVDNIFIFILNIVKKSGILIMLVDNSVKIVYILLIINRVLHSPVNNFMDIASKFIDATFP